MRLRVFSGNVEMRTQMMKLNHWIIERYAHENLRVLRTKLEY